MKREVESFIEERAAAFCREREARFLEDKEMLMEFAEENLPAMCEKLMATGEIEISKEDVWVLVPNENIFSPAMRAFFKRANPKQLYAKLGEISSAYGKRLLKEVEEKRAEEGGEQVAWETIMEIIRSVPGIGKVKAERIDSTVREQMEG